MLRKKGMFSCAVINKRIYWNYTFPGKDMDDNFGQAEVGGTDAIQGKVDDFSTIYGVWRILIMWLRWWLLVDVFWRMIHTRRLWEDGRKMDKTWWRSLSTSCHLIGIFGTVMPLTTTTTSEMHCHQLKIHGWLIGGSVGYFISFCPSQRLMHLWFYATLYTVGYVWRECLRYWSFSEVGVETYWQHIWVLARLYSSVYNYTKEHDKISEPDMDFHWKTTYQ